MVLLDHICKGKDPLLFRINQVNTIAAFMVTTTEDYVEFNIGGEVKSITFEDH